VVNTGIWLQVPPTYTGKLEGKSGISTYRALSIQAGVIDAGRGILFFYILYVYINISFLFFISKKTMHLTPKNLFT